MKTILLAQKIRTVRQLKGLAVGERPTGDDWDDHVVSVLNTCDAIVLGRKTYELLGGYWPNDGSGRRGALPSTGHLLMSFT